MPDRDPLTAEAVAFDHMVRRIVPDALRSCGCERARDNLNSKVSANASDDNIVDALDAAGVEALKASVHQDPEQAARTERIHVLVCHLAEHLTLEGKDDDGAANGHLQRAIAVAEDLGLRVLPGRMAS